MIKNIDISGELDPVKRVLIRAIRKLESSIPDHEEELQKYTQLRQEAHDSVRRCKEDLAVLKAELEKRRISNQSVGIYETREPHGLSGDEDLAVLEDDGDGFVRVKAK